MPARPGTVVFVHGWSVRSTDTYGRFPERLASAASRLGWPLQVRHVWLGKYVSFRDEVTVDDIARAFEAAVRKELGELVGGGGRFACVTHSTGGPVVREWWQRYHATQGAGPGCPMSHLIMLAPANFGSALAQLGKSRLSRVKTWFQGVEPGTGVLDWLELGSPESWNLNERWIASPADAVRTGGVYPFVLTGQTIDRKLYDHLNSYTGEDGSDGVVRVAAANLNATLVRLEQGEPRTGNADRLYLQSVHTAPRTCFKIVPGRSHSGRDIGILRSVENDAAPHPSVDAVMRCLSVASYDEYEALRLEFDRENVKTQEEERLDVVTRRLFPDSRFIIDPFSMIVFRIRDDRGKQIGEFDLKLTAAPASRPQSKATPDLLPPGFLKDRQRNRRHPGTLTFQLNHAIMTGCPEVRDARSGEVVRKGCEGTAKLGLTIEPHVSRGFVHFRKAELEATPERLRDIVNANRTTLVDVVMRRVVREGVMRLERLDRRNDRPFTAEAPGEPLEPE